MRASNAADIISLQNNLEKQKTELQICWQIIHYCPRAKTNAHSGAMQKAHLLITDVTRLRGFGQNLGSQ